MKIKENSVAIFGFGKPRDQVLEAKLEKLNNQIEEKKGLLSELTKQLKIANEVSSLDKELEKRKEELQDVKSRLAIMNDDVGLQEFGFFERQYKFSDSVHYKAELDDLRLQQKQLVKDGRAGVITSPLAFNNSVKKGEAIQKQLIKAAIRGFNGEADALLTKVTPGNLENKKKALQKAFEQLNKIYERNFVKLTNQYLELKAKELQLAVEYDLQKQEEKELLREQRAQEKEDRKLQAEIAAKRKKLEKDRMHFKQMLDNVEALMKSASEEEKEELKLQLSEYQNKLSELDEIEEDIDYREGHASAGYVYVISNIGSFGEDVYKIGVTRRLEPLERIRELSSASVPFQFDVHALVFSEEAFALETELHNQLAEFKVNKVNGRKEYFRVPFDRIKEILSAHKELAIELTEKAEAFEYRQGLLKGTK